jgi:mono/diheme cytochrome c family protein
MGRWKGWLCCLCLKRLSLILFISCANGPIPGAPERTGSGGGISDPDSAGPVVLQPNGKPWPEISLALEDAVVTNPPPSVRVEVPKDPVYKWEKRTFDAYSLKEVLSREKDFAVIQEAATREPYALVFVALDRFKVALPFEYLELGKGFLAYREFQRADGKDWGLIPSSEQAETPAPFYLVWTIPEPSFDYPTPYQVAHFKAIPMRRVYSAAAPRSAEVTEGFRRFSTRCVWCHSVNYSGGRKAKEMNVPDNLTERLTREAYENHLLGRGTYGNPRPGCSLMNSPQEERDAVWQYLSSMKSQKICSSAKECENFKDK